MGVIQVVSNQPGAGKTCLIGALLDGLRRQGRTAAYYRPFSPMPQNDPDVAFISREFLSSADAPPVPAPQPVPASDGDPLTQQARESLSSLRAAAGLVLVEGPDLAQGPGPALAARVADLLDSRVLLVFRYARGTNADDVAGLAGLLGGRVAGVLINVCPPYRRREVRQDLVDDLRGRGLPVLGAIPDDRCMLAVTVQQIADHLGGRWVQEPVNTDAWVGRFLIGGNLMDSGPNYFGRFPDQAVITRSERPDIQMASMACATRCLILTGGAQPTEYVRVEAAAREVPLILVDRDTISTAEALAGLQEQASARSPHKVRRFLELMEEHLDPAGLEALLGGQAREG